MAQNPRIALIISSTRPTRWADKPKEWALQKMQERDDIDVEGGELCKERDVRNGIFRGGT